MYLYISILDSEQSVGCIDFTMRFYLYYFFIIVSEQTFSTVKMVQSPTSMKVSDIKSDLVGSFGR